MTKRSRVGFLWLLALLLGSSCAIGADPMERAMDRSREAVETGVERGRSDAESRTALWVQARYNPCKCPAPAFEMYTRGRWKRVIVEDQDGVVDDLIEAMEELQEAGRLPRATVQGSFNGSTEFEENGAEYERFTVTDFTVGDQ